MHKPRNLAAKTPLLRKGGIHQKSKSAERSKAKQALRREAKSWSKGANWPPSSLWGRILIV